MSNLLIGVLGSMIAGYCFLLCLKVVYFLKLRNFKGTYLEVGNADLPGLISYTVNFSLDRFFYPTSVLTLIIERVAPDGGNWYGKSTSDILNPYFFKGFYFIKNRDVANKWNFAKDGWNEIYLFDIPEMDGIQSKKRIGITLHYLDEIKEGNRQKREWKSSDGYYIEREK